MWHDDAHKLDVRLPPPPYPPQRRTQEQAKAHAREGEDKEVHDREEELRAKLREAEQRCQELQESMEKVREAGKRRGSIAVVPPAAPGDPAGGRDDMAPPKLSIDVSGKRKNSWILMMV